MATNQGVAHSAKAMALKGRVEQLEAANAGLIAALESVVGVFEGQEDVPIYVRKARAAIRKAMGR